MNQQIKILDREYRLLCGKRDQIKKDLNVNKAKLKKLYGERKKLAKARGLLLLFSRSVQEEIKEQIENIITDALKTVLRDRPYEFSLKFKPRKNRIDCIPIVYDGNVNLSPKDDMGGGSWPVIGFPLRVVFLGNNRPLIWLDEPLKGALGRENDLMLRALRVFKDVSSKLGIQVIINSHEADFQEIADNTIKIRHNGRWSVVENERRIIER